MTPCLSGLALPDITKLFAELSPPPPAYRAAQVYRWVREGITSYDGMTNIDAVLRRRLSGLWPLRCTAVDGVFESKDGTVKLRIKLKDGGVVEAVILEDGGGRRTACLSSQAGCPMGCVFCKTGSLRFLRNLDAAEIMEQLYHINARLKGYGNEGVSNIVFMGMGEPLLNLAVLQKVCSILSGQPEAMSGQFGEGYGLSGERVKAEMPAKGYPCFSKKRLTVSTCGLAEKIREMAAEGPDIRLAVSITTARQELRRALMPAASSLAELKAALLFYKERRKRRITLELPLFDGLNTSAADAVSLAAFAAGLDVIINLIQWNPVDGLLFEGKPLIRPRPQTMERFRAELERRGLKTSLRLSKGGTISGACGQLGAAAAP